MARVAKVIIKKYRKDSIYYNFPLPPLPPLPPPLVFFTNGGGKGGGKAPDGFATLIKFEFEAEIARIDFPVKIKKSKNFILCSYPEPPNPHPPPPTRAPAPPPETSA